MAPRHRKVVSSAAVSYSVVKVQGHLKSPLKCWSAGSLKICAFPEKTQIILFCPPFTSLSEASQYRENGEAVFISAGSNFESFCGFHNLPHMGEREKAEFIRVARIFLRKF